MAGLRLEGSPTGRAADSGHSRAAGLALSPGRRGVEEEEESPAVHPPSVRRPWDFGRATHTIHMPVMLKAGRAMGRTTQAGILGRRMGTPDGEPAPASALPTMQGAADQPQLPFLQQLLDGHNSSHHLGLALHKLSRGGASPAWDGASPPPGLVWMDGWVGWWGGGQPCFPGPTSLGGSTQKSAPLLSMGLFYQESVEMIAASKPILGRSTQKLVLAQSTGITPR